MPPSTSAASAASIAAVLAVFVRLRIGRCMGLLGVFLFVIGVWAWNWAILSIEDKSDIRRGPPQSYEDRLEVKQVWAVSGRGYEEWLATSLYRRILDPRVPTDFALERHPVPGLKQGEAHGDREKIDTRWWKKVAYRGHARWTDGDSDTEAPDYVKLRGDWVATPEKVRDDKLKHQWRKFQQETWARITRK